jgi:glutaminyl-peptide cyclotransferase
MKHLQHISLLLVTTTVLIFSCNNPDRTSVEQETAPSTGIPPPAVLQYNVLNVYPHDTNSFTQGLIVHNGQLMEGTGGSPDYSHYVSWVGKVDLKTGKASSKVVLDKKYFGEGITILKNKLYQLTWTSKVGFVYDLATMKKLQEFPLRTEGWGITNDSSNLILSDGSSNLYYLDTANFSTIKVLGVSDNNGPVNNLNELEFINGYIYANRYQTNYILKIDPSNGHVVGIADLTGLLQKYSKEDLTLPKYQNGDGVLNGIAYDATGRKIYVTGKLWPNLFEITLQ